MAAYSPLASYRSLQRNESVLEHVIRHLPALGDSFRRVEGPVDTEVNSALAVLFLRLGQRGETARDERSHVAVVVQRRAIELVRDERERNRIGPVEFSQDLKERAAEAGVPGRVCRKGGREVRPGEVAGGRAERRESRISISRRIAVADSARASPLVGLTDTGNRTPELVVVLGLPDGDAGVGHRYVHKRQKARQLDLIRANLISDFHCDLVVQLRRRAQAGSAVIGPVDTDLGLFLRARRGRNDAIAAALLHLIERGHILWAAQGRWKWNPELLGRPQSKRCNVSPVCAQSERDQTDRVLAPLPRLITGDEIDADTRLGTLRAIVGSKREDLGRRLVSEIDSVRFSTSVRDLSE